MFSITCTAVPATFNAQQRILDGLDAAISQLRAQAVCDVELKRARNQAEFAYFTERDGPYHAGFHLGYFDSLSRWQNAYAWGERLRAVTASDVQRVSRKFLNPDNRVVGWLSGAQAPKGAAPKPAEPPAAQPKTPPSKQVDHVHLTGYKDDDSAAAPSQQQAAKPRTVQSTIKEIPQALPTAVRDIPAALGSAPSAFKQIPQAVNAVPAVIKEIPAALGGIPAAIKEIPSAIGSIPSAIREIPSAIGGLPGAAATAIKDLPSAIGGIPGAAASTIRGLPGAVGGIPGAAATAIKGVAYEIGGIPGAIGNKLANMGTKSDIVSPHLTRRILKNGMTLLVFESHISPIVQVTGAVKAGEAYEPQGKKGLSSVVTTTLNQGSARRSKLQMNTGQEDLGLPPAYFLHFDQDSETINFQTRCLTRDLGTQLEMIGESLNTPALDEDEFTRAKVDTVNAIKQGDDAAEEKADRALLRSLLAPGSPFLPADPYEKIRSVGNLTLTDEQRFFGNFVVPAATTIVVAGDIDADRAASMCEKIFGTWNGKGSHPRLHAHGNQRRVLRATVPIKDKTKTVICLGQLVPVSADSQEYGSMLIADGILVHHPMISRLHQKLTAEPALAHLVSEDAIEASMTPMAGSIGWQLSISMEPNAVPAAVQTIKSEMNKMAKTGITAEEFSEAKRYLLGSLAVRDLSNLGGLSRSILGASVHAEDAGGAYNSISSVRSATLESVNHLIHNVFRLDQATLVIAGSAQSIKSVRSQLAEHSAPSLEPSEGGADNAPADNASSSMELNRYRSNCEPRDNSLSAGVKSPSAQ